MDAESQISEIVDTWQQKQEQGQDVNVADLCADAPELLAQVQSQIKALERMEALKRHFECPADDAPFSDKAIDSHFGQQTPAREQPQWERDTDANLSLDQTQTDFRTLIPGYELHEKLGAGGMAVVFKARYLPLNQFRAIKFLRTVVGLGAEQVKRFEREAKILAQLEHEHIVTVHDVQLHERHPYLVMPLVRGGCLADRIKDYANDPRQAAALVEKVARAVHHAHEKGIIHRDLKPGNILLNEERKPLVSDFGIAMLREAGWQERAPDGGIDTADVESITTRMTRDGTAVGTVPYMSPEQVNGQLNAIDRTTDIWALGVILYQLLTGSRPFRAKSSTELVQQITTGSIQPPEANVKPLDRSLANIVGKCLQVEPARRYHTAEELAIDLFAWRTGNGFKHETWGRWCMRQVRRWLAPAGVGSSMLLLFLWASGVFNATIDPEQHAQLNPTIDEEQKYFEDARTISEKLQRGEPVTLIGEKGGPVASRWVAGDDTSQKITPDSFYIVSPSSLSMLELVHDPHTNHYRIDAEVRHRMAEPPGSVGIYFGHRPFLTTRGMLHSFLELSYSDLISDQDITEDFRKQVPQLKPSEFRGNRAELYQRFYSSWRQPVCWDDKSPGGTVARFQPAGFYKTPWRKLSVVMQPESIKATWEGIETIVIPIGQQVKNNLAHFQSRRKLHGDDETLGIVTPYVHLRGSFGLYVNWASASFRNVVITPLR